jgi:hypothetical protein
MAIVSFCSLLSHLTSPHLLQSGAGRLKCEKQWRRLWFIWYLDDQLSVVVLVWCGWLSWAWYLSVEKGQWNETGEGLPGTTLVAVTFILAPGLGELVVMLISIPSVIKYLSLFNLFLY